MVRAGLFSGITIYYYYNRKNSKYIKRIHSSMKYILLFAYAFCIISMYLRMLDALLYVSQLPSLHTTSVGACIIENFFVNSACSSAFHFFIGYSSAFQPGVSYFTIWAGLRCEQKNTFFIYSPDGISFLLNMWKGILSF